MSWKQRGIVTFRQAFKGRFFESLRSKKNSTWQQCDTKSEQQSLDCCASKSLMDEAPVPEGSWSENFERRNSKNNQILIAGVATFLVTYSIVYNTGFVKGYPSVSLFF